MGALWGARLAALGAALAALGLLWGHGYGHGRAAALAEQSAVLIEAQRAQFRAAEEASRIEAQRIEAQAALDAAARQLEDMANAEPPSATCALPLPRVMRLRER